MATVMHRYKAYLPYPERDDAGRENPQWVFLKQIIADHHGYDTGSGTDFSVWDVTFLVPAGESKNLQFALAAKRIEFARFGTDPDGDGFLSDSEMYDWETWWRN